jgi:hypothetical protein
LFIRGEKVLCGFDYDIGDAITTSLQYSGISIISGTNITALASYGDKEGMYQPVKLSTDKASFGYENILVIFLLKKTHLVLSFKQLVVFLIFLMV